MVLLDERGEPTGTAPKADIHTTRTPLHLAFSCHVVDLHGRVLLTRRAATKRTWPSTWTNACCGHPRAGETLREAVVRRLGEELGIRPDRLALAIPDFVYRAVMSDGTAEHELCPVVIAEVDSERVTIDPDPSEVDEVAWLPWPAVKARALTDPASLSPWSVRQIQALDELAPSPFHWLDDHAGRPAAGLDRPVTTRPRLEAIAVSGVPAEPTARVERCLAAYLSAQPGDDLTRVIAALVGAGGKRLRPSFVWWGHAAAGGQGVRTEEAAVHAGAAMELLHSFALIHDDVMDRSATRRGLPAAHVALTGDGERDQWFGISAAILAGDLAFVWADELFDRSDPSARARQVFNRLRCEVIAGQYLDLQSAPTEAAARRVALLKTARYTVTRPLQLGAALAEPGADHALDRALERYGDAVGTAFQLRDDILGVFGDPAATGKGRLDDLREGKRTLLVIRALELATEHQRVVIERALGDPTLDDVRAERCREAIAATGARASVEALIAALRDEAVAAIESVDIPVEARAALRHLAAICTERRS